MSEIDTRKGLGIYETAGGYHIVSELAHSFDYHIGKEMRLRISPKFTLRSGKVVNPEPELILCKCGKRKQNDTRLLADWNCMLLAVHDNRGENSELSDIYAKDNLGV